MFYLAHLNTTYSHSGDEQISINQKRVNYAKQSQFQKCRNEYNFSNSNNYQQKITNNELLKTKPIQTQTKPILLDLMASKIALSAAEGPIKTIALRLRQIQTGLLNWAKSPFSVYNTVDMNITVVHDNNLFKQGLETAWGFSALITGLEKTILFDTGSDGSILLGNMEKLAIEPNSIDTIVLSHIHGDHTGGLVGFLKQNHNVTVYTLQSFPKKFKDNITSLGSKIVEVKQPLKIYENVHSTGQLGKLKKEQSLIIRTDKGLILITGCAHPGIVKILNTTKDLLKDDILLAIGGFHLEWETKGRIAKIISAFKKLGVRYVAPTHCSGEKARGLFERHFNANYINVGAGKTINTADLQ